MMETLKNQSRKVNHEMVHRRRVRIKNVLSQNERTPELADFPMGIKITISIQKKDKDTFKKRGNPLQKMLKPNFNAVHYLAVTFINVIQTKIRTLRMFYFFSKNMSE